MPTSRRISRKSELSKKERERLWVCGRRERYGVCLRERERESERDCVCLRDKRVREIVCV